MVKNEEKRHGIKTFVFPIKKKKIITIVRPGGGVGSLCPVNPTTGQSQPLKCEIPPFRRVTLITRGGPFNDHYYNCCYS